MTEASGLPHEVSSLAHVPANVTASFGGAIAGLSATALRLEGPGVSIKKRRAGSHRSFQVARPAIREPR